MFKEENQIWLYFLGILVMFGVLILMNNNFLTPVIYENQEIDVRVRTTPPEFRLKEKANYTANITTSFGSFTINLFQDNAPENVNTFVALSQADFYDETEFYRIVPNRLIQGGAKVDENQQLEDYGSPTLPYFLDDEINLNTLGLNQSQIELRKNEGFNDQENLDLISIRPDKYFVGMANPNQPDRNGNQFFIIFGSISQNDLQNLAGRFTIIGEVISGRNIIDRMENASYLETERFNLIQEELIIQDIEIIENL